MISGSPCAGTTRTFRLREVIPKEEAATRQAQTFNIPLVHNSLTIMHATCQEHFKHTIPIIPSVGIDAFRPAFPREGEAEISTYNERVNITFRFFRPDFAPDSIPKCKCDVPMALRAQQKARGRFSEEEMRYLWMCNGGGHSGASCGMVKPFDMFAEGRGPVLGDRATKMDTAEV